MCDISRQFGASCLPEPPLPQEGSRCYEVWMADGLFKCPLVGVCFSFAEQTQLLKKASVPIEGLTPFEIHELLVTAVETDNALSRKTGRLLRRKYEREAAVLRRLPEEDFLHRWKEGFALGRYAALLWAAATRDDLSADVRRAVYGSIHMAMHGMAEEQMLTRRRAAELERKLARQANRIRVLKEREAAFRQERERAEEGRSSLARDCAAAKETRDRLRRELERIRTGPAAGDDRESFAQNAAHQQALLEQENARLRTELAAMTERLQRQEDLMRSLLAEKRKWFERRETLQEESCADCAAACCEPVCDQRCPSCEECRKRVLIVGGVERMEALYRNLVERRGGVLDYHSGHLRNGIDELKKSLRKADIILCPVNCNSHGACLKVKELAKKHNKTFYMLPNGSLSTISRLLGGELKAD